MLMKPILINIVLIIIGISHSFAKDGWIEVKEVAADENQYKLLILNNNNVDMDIKLVHDNKIISIQNSPEERDFQEYIVLQPDKSKFKYRLYIRPTQVTEFKPTIDVVPQLLESNTDLDYYQKIYSSSQLWFEGKLNTKKQALNIIKSLSELDYEHNSDRYYELMAIQGWYMFEFGKHQQFLSVIADINIASIADTQLRYKLQYLKAAASLITGQFKQSISGFLLILKWLDNDRNINRAWQLNRELIRGDLGLAKAISSYHDNNGVVHGFDEINKAIFNSIKLGDHRLTSEMFKFLSIYYGFKDEKQYVLAILETAKNYIIKAKTEEGLVTLNNQIGVTYYELNQINRAQYYYRKALTGLSNDINSFGYASILINLARTYEVTGDYLRAKRLYNNALEIMQEEESRYHIAFVNNRLGLIERKLGNYDSAINHHTQSIVYFKNISNNLLVKSINELSQDYLSDKDLKAAEKIALIAIIIGDLQFLEEISNKKEYLPSLAQFHPDFQLNIDNKFNFLMELSLVEIKQILSQLDTYEFDVKTISNFVSHKILAQISLFNSNIGQLRDYINRLDENYDFTQIPINHQLGFYELKIDYLMIIKDFDELNEIAEKAIALINETRSQFDVSDLALYWTNQAQSILNKDMNALIVQNKYSEVFDILEKYYAVNLREKRQSKTDKLISDKSKHIQQALNNYVKLERETILINNKEKQSEADEAKELFLTLNATEDSANKKVVLDYLSIEQVQTNLEQDELLLRYYINDNNAFVFVIDKDMWEVIDIPANEGLKYIVKNTIDNIKSKNFARLMLTDELLLRILPMDFITNDNYKKLIIIPDGVLNLFPFAALNISQNEDEYIPLVTRINIERTYSASDYFSSIELSSSSLRNNINSISIFANPIFIRNSNNKAIQAQFAEDNKLWEFSSLPYTEYDANSIEEIFPDFDINLLTGVNATNENFMASENRNANIIHIATHGFFNDKDLENVGLATSIVDIDNKLSAGVLAMREILYKPFTANLVVISGCETTLGKEINGEGFNSLSRGLLSQGVGSVIGTIWSISDRATPVFMREFYTNLKEMEGNVSQALNTTKSNFANKSQFKRYSHPYYWAGFVLTSSNHFISKDIFR